MGEAALAAGANPSCAVSDRFATQTHQLSPNEIRHAACRDTLAESAGFARGGGPEPGNRYSV